MFGNKKAKCQRINQVIATIDQDHLNQQQLSQRLGVSPKTIANDLVTIEKRGVLLWEDKRGRLGLFRRSSKSA